LDALSITSSGRLPFPEAKLIGSGVLVLFLEAHFYRQKRVSKAGNRGKYGFLFRHYI
jgi:hypothetical protein